MEILIVVLVVFVILAVLIILMFALFAFLRSIANAKRPEENGEEPPKSKSP